MIEFIHALPNQASIVANIKIESWKVAYKGILPDDYLSGLNATQRAEKYRNQIENDADTFIFLVWLNKKPVGTIRVQIDRTSDEDSIAILEDIYFLKEYQGMGFGARGYQFVINFVKKRNCKIIYAFIFVKNLKAIKAAIKVGFIATDLIKQHGKSGELLQQYIYIVDQNC